MFISRILLVISSFLSVSWRWASLISALDRLLLAVILNRLLEVPFWTAAQIERRLAYKEDTIISVHTGNGCGFSEDLGYFRGHLDYHVLFGGDFLVSSLDPCLHPSLKRLAYECIDHVGQVLPT